MTRTARNICTCAVFATSSFNFGLPTYFVSHYCYSRALYAVFYRKVWFKKKYSRAVDCDVKSHTSVGVYRVDTMFCFASSVQLALVHLKI